MQTKTTDKNKKNTGKAFSLIEVIIAIALFMLIAPAITNLTFGGLSSVTRSGDRVEAAAYGQEALEAARSIKNYDWDNLTAGTHGITDANEYWELTDTPDVRDKFTRTLTVTDVNPYTKELRVNVEWQPLAGITNSFSATSRLTDWKTGRWIQTLASDFTAGTTSGTLVRNINGGEVKLSTQGDWGSTSVAINKDLIGDARMKDLFAYNDILLVSTYNEPNGPEFTAFDTSFVSQGRMEQIGQVEVGYDANVIFATGGYAYIGNDEDSSEIIVVRLGDFNKVNDINLPGNHNAHAIAAAGTKLIIGTHEDEDNRDNFFVYDISAPEGALNQISSLSTDGEIDDIKIFGNYAYVATKKNTAELVIINLTNYSIVSEIDLDGSADANAIQIDAIKNKAYVGRDESSAAELNIFDISSPGSAVLTGSIDLDSDINDLSISGDLIYAGTNERRKREIAVFDTKRLSVITYIDLSGSSSVKTLIFSGDYLYAGSLNTTNTIQVIQASDGDWALAGTLTSYDIPGTSGGRDITVQDDYAYIVLKNNSSGAELYIFHLVTPAAPALVGTYEIGNDVNAIAVSGNYAYLATSHNSQELMVLDISNKVDPVRTETYDTNGSSDGLSTFISGPTLYFGTGSDLYIFDISNPATGVNMLGRYYVGKEVRSVVVSNGTAYIARKDSSGELELINVSNAASPTRKALYNIAGTHQSYDLAYTDGLIYFVTDDSYSDSDFFIIDPSDPQNITLVGALNLARHNYDIAIDDEKRLAFIGTGQSIEQLTVLDISDPAEPKLHAFYDAGDKVYGVAFSKKNAYLATNNSGSEFMIIGPSSPGEYVSQGTFTSSPFDSGSANTSYRNIAWTTENSDDAHFAVQIRTADTQAGLALADWVGPDGTGNTFYTASSSPITISGTSTGNRWIQYKLYFQGSGSSTATLEDISIIYAQ